VPLASRLDQWKPLLPAALLAVPLCASLTWQGLEWLRLLRSPPPTVASSAQGPAAPAITVTRLAPLFGPTSGRQLAPATRLRLTLQGSFVSADPQRSSAIIQAEGGQPGHYLVGKEVSSGVRLHAVHSDRVEIEHDGRLETLRFPSQGKARVATGAPATGASEATPLQLEELPEENLDQLRERLSQLRQQVEAEIAEEMSGGESSQ